MSRESSVVTIPQIRNIYYTTYALLPTTNLRIGALGYATDLKTLYRWSGAAWQNITPEWYLTTFQNMLFNGDFEEGDPPDGWIPTQCTILRESAIFHEGIRSLKMHTPVGVWGLVTQALPNPTELRGLTITMGAWCYSPAGNTEDQRIGITSDGGGGDSYSEVCPKDAAWHWLTVTHTVGAAATLVYPRFFVAAGAFNAGDIFYVDGAMLVMGEVAPRFYPKSAALYLNDVEVYNGASPIAWTDLDLSGTVGIQNTLVILKITETGNVGVVDSAFRRNGDTDEFYQATRHSLACGYGGQNSAFHSVIMVVTDGAGIVEWITAAARTVTIDIIGFIR